MPDIRGSWSGRRVRAESVVPRVPPRKGWAPPSLQVPESSRTIAELVLHGFGEPGMVLRVAVKLIYQMFTKLLS